MFEIKSIRPHRYRGTIIRERNGHTAINHTMTTEEFISFIKEKELEITDSHTTKILVSILERMLENYLENDFHSRMSGKIKINDMLILECYEVLYLVDYPDKSIRYVLSDSSKLDAKTLILIHTYDIGLYRVLCELEELGMIEYNNAECIRNTVASYIASKEVKDLNAELPTF